MSRVRLPFENINRRRFKASRRRIEMKKRALAWFELFMCLKGVYGRCES